MAGFVLARPRALFDDNLAVMLAKASTLRGERAAPKRAEVAPSAPLYPVCLTGGVIDVIVSAPLVGQIYFTTCYL